MIFTDRIITVKKGASSIDDTIVLYRGDKEVEIRFTLNESSPFRFGSGAEPNIIEKTEAAYGQLVIKTPNDLPSIFSEIAPTNEGKIVFTITAEMIDEITEVGNYAFQIRLLDESMNSRATLPEVVDGIEIREPIATEDVSTTNEVGVATVGYAVTTAGTTEDTFDSQGNYNKTTWGTGDRITATKLNKIEAGIDGVNQKVASGSTGGETGVDLSIYQTKTDNTLNTTNKTVSGAINEINEAMVIAEEQTGDITVGEVSVGGSNKASDITITDTAGNYTSNNVEGALQEVGSQIKENVKDIHSRIDNIVASAGDGTKDTEIIDARGGDVCLNNRLVGIENGEYINEVSFDKIKKTRPKGEKYTIDAFSTWSKWSSTTGDTNKVTSLDNGGINISIPDNLTGNLVVSKSNINLQGKKVTLKFDITVTSEPTTEARFNLALNDSLTLTTIFLNKYKTNKKTTISIDFNDDKLLSGKLSFVFRFACNFKLENIQLEECTAVEGYQSLEEVINDVTLLKNNSEDVRDFILPSTIPTVSELETNIFWDNILLNTNIKNVSRIDVANSIGGRKNVMEDRWRILLPKGTTDIIQTFEVYFDNTSKQDKKVTANIKVLDKSMGSGLTKKIIFIGDSLTDNNIYEPELINMFADDVMHIELLGSRGSSPALHEGRSGWTTKHYCTEESYNNRTNAFFNTATSKFDFSYYMNNQGYTDVDYVFINMGTNDLANSNSETLGYFKEMVQSIKNYNNNISVFIGLCPPLSSQHDNVGFKNKRIQLMQLLLAEFDNRESEKIFINPLVLNFDAKNGFPTQTITGTRHNEELKVVTDNTHPLTSEYFKMADTIYCVIKYAVSLE